MPEELPLEPDLIKVLAADTRRDILSQLRERRMTVTELARELDLGKATVHEHLDKLTGAGLVERHEDDRLWVYYGLTPRGKRLLNPDRTRFYLALASSVVAAIVAGLAVYAFMATGGLGLAGPAGDEAATSPDAMVAPSTEEVYAGEQIEVPTETDAEDVHAYLVDEEGAQRLRQGDYDVEGVPLRAYTQTTAEAGDVQASDDHMVLRSDAALDPGTYYLYVRSDEGDNADRMPAIRLVQVDATPDRGTWVQSLDRGPLTIEITREGQPLPGEARLAGPAGTSASVPIRDGRAQLSASTLDRLSPGTYDVTVQPEDRTRWVSTGDRLTVNPPSLAVHPLHVREHGASPVDVDLSGPPRLYEQAPSVPDASADIAETEDGWSVNLSEAEPGPVEIRLARTSATVTVHPSVHLAATVQDGPEVRWTVTANEQPLEGAAVYLDGQAQGFTDEDGQLRTRLPDEGVHRLGVHRPDGATVTQAITVDGWRIAPVQANVSLQPTDLGSPAAGGVAIGVELANEVPHEQPVTLVAAVDGRPAASRALELPAQANLTTNITVPADLGRQSVTLSAEPLQANPFTYENATSGADEAEAEQGTGDGDGETATARVGVDHVSGEGATVEEIADGDDMEGGAPSPREPVHPRAAADAASGEEAEAPMLGPLAVAVVVLASLWAARTRKP